MADYGRNIIGSTGSPVELAAMPPYEWAPFGVTVDWNSVAAVGSDTLIAAEGLTVKAGSKYLRCGQVLTTVTQSETDTITITGTPTGGTFAVTVTTPDGNAQTTPGIAYNANAAAVQTAIQALSNVGSGKATVTGSAPLIVTFDPSLGNVAVSANGAALTGGSTPAATAAETFSGTRVGKVGPYDPAASDGRQTLTPGQVFLVNTTTLQNGVAGYSLMATDHPGCLVGGPVWKARILQSGVGTHTLAAGPTLAELMAAMPRLTLVGP